MKTHLGINRYLKASFPLLSSIVVLASCKRELPGLTGKDALATPSTNLTAHANALGQPASYPVELGVVTTLAGKPGNGLFAEPSGVTGDASGNVYVVDQDHHRIVKLSPAGAVLRVFGDGKPHWQDGPSAIAGFNTPSAVAIGPDGRVYVADLLNHRIRYITPAGDSVKTLAGSVQGYQDGTGAGARFNLPSGVAVDGAGTLYVTDYGNNRVRKITPLGTVSSYAGAGSAGYANGSGSAAQFNGPESVTVTPDGIAFVADVNNQRIRKIVNGVVTTVAGSSTTGSYDEIGERASFNYPTSLVVDAAGMLYVSDKGGNCIRTVAPDGRVRTIAGANNGPGGYVDSLGKYAQFAAPIGIGIDPLGNIFVADRMNQAIRKISLVPAVVAFAGNGVSGYVDSRFYGDPNAEIAGSMGLTIDPQSGTLYAVSDFARIRSITPGGTVNTLAGGVRGYAEGYGADASFKFTQANLTVGQGGNIYVADGDNYRIRQITPPGLVTTYAGNGMQGELSGPLWERVCTRPTGVVYDGSANLYYLDVRQRGTLENDGVIRKITPDGQVSTLAVLPRAGDGELGLIAGSITIDAGGNLYVSCLLKHTVFKVTPSGQVSNFLGGITSNGFLQPDLNPAGIAVDYATGNVYVGNEYSGTISIYSPGGQLLRQIGSTQSSLDYGREDHMSFNAPNSLVIDQATGILYIFSNSRICMTNK